MSVPVPNLVGRYQGGEVTVTRERIDRYYNPQGQLYHTAVYSPVQRSWITWASDKPPLVSGPISVTPSGRVWRGQTPYSRVAVNYRYTPAVKVFVNDSIPGWPGYRIESTYSGIDGGDIHFTDLGFPSNVASEASNLRSMAIVECMNKVNDGDINFGESLATSRQTAETVADTASDIMKILLLAKRGQWHRIPKEFGTIQDTLGNWFLRWQYGWRPACQDVYNITKRLRGELEAPHRMKATRNVTNSIGIDSSIYGLPVKGKAKIRALCTLHSEVDSARLANANAFGLTNPASLAWDLIPMSFVVDWFMPIGNVLGSLSTGVGLNFVGGSVSTTIEGTFNIELPLGMAECRRLEHSREVIYNWPRELLPYVKTDPIWQKKKDGSNPFRTERVVTALALLNQLR